MSEVWPRLSETLPHPRMLGYCQACGLNINEAKGEIDLWQECDAKDKPEDIFVSVCRHCNLTRNDIGEPLKARGKKGMIERHPRLYIQVARHAWLPGLMNLCFECIYSRDLNCGHPLKGKGLLKISGPTPDRFHVKGNKSTTGWYTIWKPSQTCTGRTTDADLLVNGGSR